jgi:hypothetical protein
VKAAAVYCISAGRPGNVAALEFLFAPDLVTWVVPAPERNEYRAAGAARVLPVPDPPAGRYALAAARNAALDDATAAGAVCIQTDDDLRWFARVEDGRKKPATWPEVRNALLSGLDGTAHLSGVPPTDNAMFASGRRRSYGFIIGSLCATDTDRPRWDETIPMKEDYDYTCAHLEQHGAVARMDMYLAKYAHFTNRGGAVANRSRAAERALVDRLVAKWPQYLRANARRDGELLMRQRKG